MFQADIGNTVSQGDRYIQGVLDPVQAVDQQLGFNTDSFGTTAIDPETMWGYLKRFYEHFEGDANYNKSQGIWSIYARGATTLLRQKQLTNTTTSADKSGV